MSFRGRGLPLLFSFLLLAGGVPREGHGQLIPAGWKAISPKQWGGLNLLSDSTEIDGDCQNCQNILTDSGFLEKRPGNVFLATILAGYPVQYVNEWVAPSGTRYLIAQASQTIYQTNFSGAPVALSTVQSNYNLSVVPAFSQLYFGDGFRALWSWTGNSTGTVLSAGNVAAPICTYVAYKDSRIFCANLPDGALAATGVAGGGSSRVALSSSGGAGYWNVPSNVASVDNAPNVFDFTPNDGDQINCLASTPWGMFVGKTYSSSMIKGTGNLSYYLRILDPKIGCVDNRSVQMVYGKLTWLAVDGVYEYDGTGPPKLISRELDPLVKTFRESAFTNSVWATQLQSDWQSGLVSTATNNLPAYGTWDLLDAPGTIFPSSFTLYDDNINPGIQLPSSDPANPTGLGFSSDTLVNIDTTSFPLFTGFAQTIPSSAGVSVWALSASNYTTGVTTWTSYEGFPTLAGASCSTYGKGSCLVGTVSGGRNTIYSVNAATVSAPTSAGWMVGYSSFTWLPVGNGSDAESAQCAEFGGADNAECFEINFINTGGQSFTPPGGPATTRTAYGLKVNMNSCTVPSSTQSCQYIATIYKDVAGIRTTLASQSFTPVIFTSSTFAITRTAGGLITVLIIPAVTAPNTTLTVQAQDNTNVLNNYAYSITVYSENVGSGWFNYIYNIAFYGYGPGTITSRIYNAGIAAPLSGTIVPTYLTPGLATDTTIYWQVRNSTSPNNDLWTSWALASTSAVAGLNRQYWQYQANFGTKYSSETAQFYNISLKAVTTGYYYSKVNFIGSNITSWKQFTVSENNPGTYNYAVRSASYAFSINGASPSWNAQSANQTVATTTRTYVQFRLDSTNLTTADTAEAISGVFLRWQSGTNIPTASDTLDRRYFLCVAVSSFTTVPDTCLVHQKTGKWVYYKSSSFTAMGIYNGNMVAGAGDTTSKVWQIMQPNVYQDDGSPIDGFWVSADYTDGLLYNQKTYHESWFDAQPVQNSSVTFSYTMNKSGSWNSSQFSVDDGQALDPTKPVIGSQLGDINQYVPVANGLGYDQGKYIRVKFEDNQLNNYFRINDYLIYVEDKEHQIP